jgi:hypothetical protein
MSGAASLNINYQAKHRNSPIWEQNLKIKNLVRQWHAELTACCGFLYEYADQTFCFYENAIHLDALELSAFPQIVVTGSEKETATVFRKYGTPPS